jgi:hypothetical protein
MSDYEMILQVMQEALEDKHHQTGWFKNMPSDKREGACVIMADLIRQYLTSRFTHEMLLKAFIREWVKNQMEPDFETKLLDHVEKLVEDRKFLWRTKEGKFYKYTFKIEEEKINNSPHN